MRNEFVDWFESLLLENGFEVGRWQVDAGLEDLEIQGGVTGGSPLRLRIVRGSPNTGEVPAGRPPITRPSGTPIERR
jgi:hypothetical protein